MTNYAMTIYRRDTRAALSHVLGRPVTNDEQSNFILHLWGVSDQFLLAEAGRFAEGMKK